MSNGSNEILQPQEIERLEREKQERKRKKWRNILIIALGWMVLSIVSQKILDHQHTPSHCDQLLQQSNSYYDDETHDRNLGDTVQADHDHGLAVATFAQWEDANCATEGDKPGYVPGYGNVNTP